ncbi:hypothetical protein POM88_024035 [Heracleum sosnowskyi]|uniref:Pentatricopeptide repeat-containing protein n=1 Tax=Heracleum sosnowskyi TaxID=360622 RepID=A0AAD8IIE2_9APIA|nr:hypothetical protein POM88_024035 [Heracleum sosnowskyi]
MDGALAVLNSIRSKVMMPTCVTYNILLDAYCKQSKLDIAMDLYRNMTCEGLKPTVETHNTLLHGLCGLGKPMEALTFLYKIQDQGYMLDIVTYRTLLDGLCKNRCSYNHFITATTLIRSAGSNSPCNASEVLAFRFHSPVLCKLNKWEEVNLLLKQMMDKLNISPDVHTSNILIDAYSKSGKLDDAKRLIEMMNERGDYPDLVSNTTLMHTYCTQGQMDGAFGCAGKH